MTPIEPGRTSTQKSIRVLIGMAQFRVTQIVERETPDRRAHHHRSELSALRAALKFMNVPHSEIPSLPPSHLRKES